VGGAWGGEIVLADFRQAQTAVADSWELVVKTGEPQLQLVQDPDGQALQLRSTHASFALQRKVNISLQDYPYLVWQWKVTTLPEEGDFRHAHTDDQAAQLIVAFSSNRFLSYVWDSTAPKGMLAEAPSQSFLGVAVLVLQSGRQELGTWMTERRNLIEDYMRAFGEAPETMKGLRIQINSQHTRSQAETYWKSIALQSNP
jgi:hypothetical protein